MPLAVILLILGGFLSGLVMVAVVQRRGQDALVVPPGIYVNGPQAAFEASYDTPSAPPTWTLVSIGRIAAGVWLGLWLFVFSVAIPAIFIIHRLIESGW